MRPAEEAEELVEARVRSAGSPSRVPRCHLPTMPGRVAGRLEPLGQRLFVADQAEFVGRVADRARIELVPEPLLIAARSSSRPASDCRRDRRRSPLVNRTPFLAIESICGVGMSLCPWQPSSP